MRLQIYSVSLQLVRAVAPSLAALRARSGPLADQLERALTSVPLNIAEGRLSRGRNRQARFQSAAASAQESLACLETAAAFGWLDPVPPEVERLFNQVIGTLVRLIEPKR